MSKVITVACDVCKSHKAVKVDQLIPVVFVTEQTEGRSIDPYLLTAKMDICDSCLQRMTDNRELLTGSGAQGHNEYWFKEK